MKLEAVEKKLHMTYPKDFRDIYLTGAMNWLCGGPQQKTHLLPDQLLAPGQGPGWSLLPFSKVEKLSRHLTACIPPPEDRFMTEPRPLPFAWKEGKYILFFDVALGGISTVFSWYEIPQEARVFCDSFEEFICASLCRPVVEGNQQDPWYVKGNELPLDHWWIQNQLHWLTPEHQARFHLNKPSALEELLYYEVTAWGWGPPDYWTYRTRLKRK